MCFLQETKRGDIMTLLVSRLWGGDDFKWLAQPSCGLFGGILSIWLKGIFNFLFSFSQPGFVGVALEQEGGTVYCQCIFGLFH